jgi:hypothetical protein
VVVSEKDDKVQSVYLHASPLIDSLEDVEGEELAFFCKNFLLVLSLPDGADLLGYDSGN